MPSFRPYEVVPGSPIEIEVVGEDGARVVVVGTVDKVTDLAGNRVMRMRVTRARFTPLPAAE